MKQVAQYESRAARTAKRGRRLGQNMTTDCRPIRPGNGLNGSVNGYVKGASTSSVLSQKPPTYIRNHRALSFGRGGVTGPPVRPPGGLATRPFTSLDSWDLPAVRASP